MPNLLVEIQNIGKQSRLGFDRGAAISSLDGASAESGGESAVLSKRESVPSISLPRQCTHVRHFAMGAFRIQQSTFRLVSDRRFRGMIDMGLASQVGVLFSR